MKLQCRANPFLVLLIAVITLQNGFANPAESSSEPKTSSGDAAINQLLDRVWDFQLTEFPLLATDVGDPRGQDRLADQSLDAIDRRHKKTVEFLAELQSIEPESLSPLRQIDYAILQQSLEADIAEHDFQSYLMPINNREGFHISFPELPRVMNPRTREDFANYVSRLNAFSEYTDQYITRMRKGIDAGLTQPAIILRDSVDQVMAQVVDDPSKSLLMTNINEEAKDRFDAATWAQITAEIEAAIESSVIPSYQRLADFLKDEYLPACRGTIGASSLPNGRAFYRNRTRHFTTLDIAPEEVHEIGRRENKRIRQEMEAIREQLNFAGDLPTFIQHLRTDPKFYPKTADELLQRVALVLKRADGRLPELFGRLPRIPYGIREVPAYVAPQTSSAYYWPPATDGSRGGYYYINTYNLSSRPLYQIESLSLHEAVPGHHLQLALQAELEGLHPLSRQSNFTAFIEGWALYSERLGKEIGFYKDPYQDFGRLSMEAWRASRLVVDTGIHFLGWSRQQAIEYMRDNTALSEHNIVAEVDRYIGWPGQALGYKMGELTISRLRAESEAELGDAFDLRSFHDRVLSVGSIPLPLLEKRILQWRAEQAEQ
ncbi:secreted protein containing DUF885, bacterial [Rhodopirellula maiorica SM1]|uniref:Secreted protein containing DUF885, bacterial n=1 Tax=Rhodopirellula maiorica SM1 TaxID=1265738 RepID=M5RTK0_9BACT|nr:DUF885 domain-containing protein [Rhodopirellula maiorica]EMI22531.1 secreted protein containing DUF885, bacterial [Rhodopirellula maiorica SM1]